MAILTTMRVKGDPDEVLRKKHEVVDPILKDIAAQNGGIEHLVVKTDDGIMIINLWENEEGMNAVRDEVRPKAEAAGIAPPTDWQQYELVQREVV